MLCTGLDRIACCGQSLGTQIDCFKREATRGRRMYREPQAQLGVRRDAPIVPVSLELTANRLAADVTYLDFLSASTSERRTNSLIGTPVSLDRASKAFFRVGSI